MRAARYLSVSVAVYVLAGCSDVTVRGCPLTSSSNSNTYDLQYEVLLPSDCPVPLSIPGSDVKYAAANVYDGGSSDFTYAYAEVDNSLGIFQNVDLEEFKLSTGSTYYASPTTTYTAATGTGSYSDYDYGYFVATNTPSAPSASDPYGRIRITYKQSALAAKGIGGAVIPSSNTSQTWSLSPSGGVPPYSISWYRDSVLVGSGSTYTASTGTKDFWLRAEVMDQTWSVSDAVLAVDVDGVRASITGPTSVYDFDLPATWTASGSGGTGPYTFDWYVDDRYVATGPEYTGGDYPPRFKLTLRMRDAAGASNDATETVTIYDSSCTGISCPPK